MQTPQEIAFVLRQFRDVSMQPERCLVEQSLRAADVLDNDPLREPVQLLFFLSRQVFPGVNDDGQLLMLGPDLLDQFETGYVRQIQVENKAINLLIAKCGQTLRCA